jgi:hypothetical protein
MFSGFWCAGQSTLAPEFGGSAAVSPAKAKRAHGHNNV